MTCDDVRADLPDLVAGALPDEQATLLHTHLTSCPDCRHVQQELAEVSRLLHALPAPAVQIDLTALYREAQRRQERQLRRWRRRAMLGAVAAAALLLVSILPALQVQFQEHQLVLRWGVLPENPPAPEPPSRTAAFDAEQELRRLKSLEQLLQALALEMQTQELRRADELARLREQLDHFTRQVTLQLEANGIRFHTQHVERPFLKGENP